MFGLKLLLILEDNQYSQLVLWGCGPRQLGEDRTQEGKAASGRLLRRKGHGKTSFLCAVPRLWDLKTHQKTIEGWGTNKADSHHEEAEDYPTRAESFSGRQHL